MEINSFEELLVAMKNCFQFENVNIYEHGIMVNKEYFNIVTMLSSGCIIDPLPKELLDIYMHHTLLPFSLMMTYQILHDCGKPLCHIVDENGKSHYPNHAFVSYSEIKKYFPEEYDLQYLIAHDMDFHTMKPSQLINLSKSKYGFSLYLTAWAELIANSQMFGGFQSTSFKIKKKHLLKCLKLFK